MKAIINTQALGKVLRQLSPVIKKNTVLPILNSVMLQFKKNNLTVTATDLETVIMSMIDCDSKDEFDVIIEYKTIADLCSKMPEPIFIESTDKQILITGGSSKFKFPKSIDAGMFPQVTADDFIFDLEVDSDFFWALSCANSCKSQDSNRVGLNAPCIHIKKDSVTVVGTNALILYKQTLKIKTGKEAMVMVSEQFVQLTKHLLQGKISIAERFIKLESDNLTIISKLPEGKFCLYESIIRDDISFNFKTNRKDLIKSLELTGVVADTSTHQSCINFNGNSIKIVTQDIAFETEGENELKAQFDVELEKIGINGNQMLSLLNLIDSEDVEMAFTEINKTIYLRPSGEPHTLCLLQPVSLQ